MLPVAALTLTMSAAAFVPRPLMRSPPQHLAAAVFAQVDDSFPDMMDSLPDLIDLAVSLEDKQRHALVKGTVESWPASERKENSDRVSDLLTERAVRVQSAALEAHERGEDVSSAATELQRIVDMTVQVKVVVRNLKRADVSALEDALKNSGDPPA